MKALVKWLLDCFKIKASTIFEKLVDQAVFTRPRSLSIFKSLDTLFEFYQIDFLVQNVL
jgi:hypothetical protein